MDKEIPFICLVTLETQSKSYNLLTSILTHEEPMNPNVFAGGCWQPTLSPDVISPLFAAEVTGKFQFSLLTCE
ncbi:hypothetical protein [Desulfosediminicola sp.]|uniref:hypothetical protein n=1 Tax=Desulfosediminicola sp. TaxID=2886825 RepID=UPI003AF2D454